MNENAALRHYHLFDATLGELYRRAGDLDKARRYLEAARSKDPLASMTARSSTAGWQRCRR